MKMYHLVEAESLWALSQRGAVNLPQVRQLQDRLRAAGHDPGPSDGWYGRNTANAVRAYQEANGLTVDGDAGPQTLASLGMSGANNTPPRETPPEETPPAPAPRQPSAEPPDEPAAAPARPWQDPDRQPEREPAPAPTTREPERTSSPAGVRSARPGEYISVTRQTSGRELRNAIRSIPGAIFDWEQGSFSNGIIFINLIDYVSDDRTGSSITAGQNRARQAKNQFLDFIRGDVEGFSIFVNDSNGTYVMAFNNQTLDEMPASASTTTPPPTTSRPEPEPRSQPNSNDPRETLDWQRYAADIRRQITRNLFDADSARFRDVEVRRVTRDVTGLREGNYIIVGEVNGKNRYGAYVGFRVFYTLDVSFLQNGRLFVLMTTIEGGDANSREIDRRFYQRSVDASEKVADLELR